MSKLKFTPGPWEVDLENGEITANHKDSFAVLGTLYDVEDFPCLENEEQFLTERIANANLIAAAPELFQSLIDVLAFARLKWGNLNEDANTVMDKAAEVIAKARGEE